MESTSFDNNVPTDEDWRVIDRTDEFNQMARDGVSETRLSRSSIHTTSNILEKEVALFIKEFLRQAEQIWKMLSLMDNNIKDVTDVQSVVLEFSETDERLYEFYDRIRKGFNRIAETINNLENSLDVTKFYGSDTELRICNLQLLTLKRKLSCSVSDYYNIQEDYKEKCRDRVKRQAQISGADVSKIDIDSAIGCKTDLFLQTVFPDFNVTYHYLNEIRKQHEDLLRLENSLVELRDLIFDLHLIVKIDQSLINRIDRHSRVVNALSIEAKGHTKEYRGSLKTQSYKTYITFCCCGIIIIIIVLALLSTFSNQTCGYTSTKNEERSTDEGSALKTDEEGKSEALKRKHYA